MTEFMKNVARLERRFDRKAESFTFHHPVLASLLMFVGLPLFVLTAVCLSTIVISLPVSWLMGIALIQSLYNLNTAHLVPYTDLTQIKI